MGKLDYCFHSHTYRCWHAYGEDEEYVVRAIGAGMKALGFSDHAMFPFFSQPHMRGDYEELPGYVASVRDLAAKYRDRIDIRLGFEAEWLGKSRSSYYRDLYRNEGFDYFILGHHMYFEGDEGDFFAHLPSYEAIPRYVDDVIEAMASGYFLYVAHPDLFMSWQWNDFGLREKSQSERLIEAAVAHDIPLELNMGYSRSGRKVLYGGVPSFPYPCPPFWDIAREKGAKVVIGVDAHGPRDYETSDYAYFEGLAAEKGLSLLSRAELLDRIASLKERWGSK